MSTSKFGPETRAIIEAINRMKRLAHENLNYQVITIDLGVGRGNELYELPGWFEYLAVGRLTGDATIRLNEVTKDAIDLTYVKTINTPIRRFFITNGVQAGCTLILALGGEAVFTGETSPRATDPGIFYFAQEDGDGVWQHLFEDDQPELTLPTHQLVNMNVRAAVKEGIALRVHYIMRPTNAVTYQLRIWTAAINGAATPNAQFAAKLWESPAAQVAAQGYDEDVEIPFILAVEAQIWFSIDWSAAPGNTTGIIHVSGVIKR